MKISGFLKKSIMTAGVNLSDKLYTEVKTITLRLKSSV